MKYKDILGWFCAENLYREAVQRAVDGAVFVEIGCFLGKSTCFMAETIKDHGKKIDFYAIDHFQGSVDQSDLVRTLGNDIYGRFVRNLQTAGVLDYVNVMVTDSLSASHAFDNDSLDFVFIDAEHDYQSVKNDLHAWFPKVKKGGIIGGDDYNPDGFIGVSTAVNEFFGDSISVFFDRVWYAEKS